uniref:Large ribosomal subunit protein bL19m n=1 Tax=Geotrypetes seraphini TaxID=260995 RepID=A0A6P8QDS9_GEOSA|nr:39S ribosomal protein L19, mitochondrial [Geotrypetes seraphini]
MAACRRRLQVQLFSGFRLNWSLHSSSRFLSIGDDEPSQFQPPPKPVIVNKMVQSSQRKFLSPEFIPPRSRKDPFKYYLERIDMVARRKLLNIPEFYVGSILAVTMSDPHASGKVNKFVGICTQRSGKGLGATFVLRNIIEGQGVEIRYDMYSPRIQEIQVLKLEKRLDDDLMYLRDALPEYSTFDFNMKPVIHPVNEEIPVNQLKVKMKPRPWSKRWERPKYKVQGIKFELYLTKEKLEEAKKWAMPWLEFDMLKEYDTTKIEERIWKEINPKLGK